MPQLLVSLLRYIFRSIHSRTQIARVEQHALIIRRSPAVKPNLLSSFATALNSNLNMLNSVEGARQNGLPGDKENRVPTLAPLSKAKPLKASSKSKYEVVVADGNKSDVASAIKSLEPLKVYNVSTNTTGDTTTTYHYCTWPECKARIAVIASNGQYSVEVRKPHEHCVQITPKPKSLHPGITGILEKALKENVGAERINDYIIEKLKPPLSTEKATGPFVGSIEVLQTQAFRTRSKTRYEELLSGGPATKRNWTDRSIPSNHAGADLFLESLFGSTEDRNKTKPLSELGKFLKARSLEEWIGFVKSSLTGLHGSGQRRTRFGGHLAISPSLCGFYGIFLGEIILAYSNGDSLGIAEDALHLFYGLSHACASHFQTLLCRSIDFARFSLDYARELNGKKALLQSIADDKSLLQVFTQCWSGFNLRHAIIEYFAAKLNDEAPLWQVKLKINSRWQPFPKSGAKHVKLSHFVFQDGEYYPRDRRQPKTSVAVE